MQKPNLEGEIDGERAYENLHVPALFKQWTHCVLVAATAGVGNRVLDVTSGTGVLARAAAV